MRKVTAYLTDPNHRHQIIIIIVWLAVQSFLLWKNGIVSDGESRKYIQEAQRLASTGTLSTANYIMYLTQIVLIMLSNKLGVGFAGVVFFQLGLNFIATMIFYRCAKFLFQSSALALLGTLILQLNYPFQEFNTFLQTESVFYSLGIVISCYVIQLASLKPGRIFFILLILILIAVTRPTGILFVPAVMLYLFFRFFPRLSIQRKLLIVGIGSAGFLFVMDAALGSGGELDFMLPYRDERIICGVPTLPGFVDIKESSNGNSVFGLAYYVFNNFGQFIRLAWLRTIAFFGLIRPYYSEVHNFFLVFYFYIIYILDLLSMRYWIRRRPVELFYFIFLTVLTWGTVLLSCDDWHNRFFLTIFPYLILLGLPSLERLTHKLDANARRTAD